MIFTGLFTRVAFTFLRSNVILFNVTLSSLITEENPCRNIYVPGYYPLLTEAQSDVLLPCNFDPALLGSDKNADIAVVWSREQKNSDLHTVLKVTRLGEVTFWTNTSGRIKMVPELTASGNFSILVQKVQLSDLGLYHCELFNGINCRIAYQEIGLC